MSEPANGLEWFGAEVAAALAHAGATQQALADATGYKQPYVSKVINGKALASPAFAEGCDRFFGTPGTFARLLERISERGHPGWFVPYLKLERDALAICDYSNAFVMGILQTPEYAEAVFRAAHPHETAAEIKARVQDRMERREVMEKDNSPLLWVILHESVLRSVVGGHSVMRDQLQHLVASVEHPRITVQVFPFTAGATPVGFPFIVLTQQDGTSILFEETHQRGKVDDSPAAVADAQAAYDRLRADALSREESLALIRKAMEAYGP